MATLKQYILLFVLSVIIGLIAGFYSIPFPILFPFLLLLMVLVLFVPIASNLYMTKNMDQVERFIKKRYKQPLFSFYYFLANNQMEKAEEALSLVLKKYRAPQYQAAYKLAYALGKNDLSSEQETIAQLKHKHLTPYYEGLLEVEKGNLIVAEEKATQVTKPWMKEVILAKIQGKLGNFSEEKVHIEEAISHTSGLQRYLLVKWKERM